MTVPVVGWNRLRRMDRRAGYVCLGLPSCCRTRSGPRVGVIAEGREAKTGACPNACPSGITQSEMQRAIPNAWDIVRQQGELAMTDVRIRDVP